MNIGKNVRSVIGGTVISTGLVLGSATGVNIYFHNNTKVQNSGYIKSCKLDGPMSYTCKKHIKKKGYQKGWVLLEKTSLMKQLKRNVKK